MQNINSIDSLDFYYNGSWLSSFGGIIAGSSGLSTLSVLPQREVKTEKVIGRDGELVYDMSYSPRTFTIPVMFNNISQLRSVASWLNSLTPTDFYFKNDTVKIKAVVDGVIDITPATLQGVTDLKFIAYDPYYYLITENAVAFTSGFTNMTVSNTGTVISYPAIKITGTGDVVITVNGTKIKVSPIDEYTVIDSLYCTAYKGDFVDTPTTGISKIGTVYDGNSVTTPPLLLGSFPTLSVGNNTIVVNSGTVTRVEVRLRQRWI